VDGSIDWKACTFVPEKTVGVRDIIAAAVLHFRLTKSDFLSKSRRRELARARQVVMFVAREITPASLPMIGRELGGLDHTSVLFGARKIAALIADGREGMADHVKAVRDLATSGNPKAALRMRDAKSRHAALEAVAEQEAEEAIRHSEQMAKLKRIRELAGAGFIATDKEGRIL